jgi:hypothetical protein
MNTEFMQDYLDYCESLSIEPNEKDQNIFMAGLICGLTKIQQIAKDGGE